MALEPKEITLDAGPGDARIESHDPASWLAPPSSAATFHDRLGQGFGARLESRRSGFGQPGRGAAGGLPFFERGWRSLATAPSTYSRSLGLGTGAAYLYSLAAVLGPALFPGSIHSAGGAVPVYFESSAVIITLVAHGAKC